MVKSGSFSRFPVRTRTTLSSGFTKPCFTNFFKTGERDGGCGLASDAFGADFGFGLSDFDFGDLFAGSAGGFENVRRFFPRGGVADADGGGAGFGLHADQAFPGGFAQRAHQRIRAFGLNHRQLGQARNQAQVAHFQQRLADRGTVSQIAAGDDDVVGRLPVELFEQFERESFLAFEAERVDRIQLVDGRAQNEFLQEARGSRRSRCATGR